MVAVIKPKDQSSTAQQKRLLEALQDPNCTGLSTIQIREQLDVMHPAGRIEELRKEFGFNIQTITRNDINAQGHLHSCAYYVLCDGEWQGDQKNERKSLNLDLFEVLETAATASNNEIQNTKTQINGESFHEK